MSALAITFLLIAIVVVWGGLVASIVFLAKKPEIAAYPDGGEDDPTTD